MLLIKRSRSVTESLVVLDSYRPAVSEVVIRHTHRMQVMHTDVHVQTCLDIVLHLPHLLELLSCPTHRIGQSLVFLRNPTSLHSCLLLLISLLLLVLAEQSGDGFDCLLGVDLAMVASWLLGLIEL